MTVTTVDEESPGAVDESFEEELASDNLVVTVVAVVFAVEHVDNFADE